MSSIIATMKLAIALLCCLAVAQALPWSGLKTRHLTRSPVNGFKPVNGRIIGGSIAQRHQFPYQVGLYLDFFGFCGGSLISDTVVLTAAHCADGTSIFDVHLGAQNINNENEIDRQVVRSRQSIVHGQWNPNTVDNDIAIIILDSPVSGTGVTPVRIPSRAQANDAMVGQRTRVSGWGRTSDSSSGISPELKFTDVTVIDNTECADYYGNIINASKICVDTVGGTEGTCNGDSGGPLVITEGDGLPTEVGIVSFGSSEGCESGAPAAFTRVTSYLDWLENNAGITIRP